MMSTPTRLIPAEAVLRGVSLHAAYKTSTVILSLTGVLTSTDSSRAPSQFLSIPTRPFSVRPGLSKDESAALDDTSAGHARLTAFR